MNDILVEQIKLLPLPEDKEKNHRTWLAPLKLNPDSVSHPAFTALVDQFMADSQGKRKEPNVSILKKHWELILLNLSQAVFKRRWLMVALNSRTQAKLPVYSDNNWSARPLAHVIDHLQQRELIHLRKGKTFSKEPLVTRIFPTDALAPQLYQFFLDTEQPIHPPQRRIRLALSALRTSFAVRLCCGASDANKPTRPVISTPRNRIMSRYFDTSSARFTLTMNMAAFVFLMECWIVEVPDIANLYELPDAVWDITPEFLWSYPWFNIANQLLIAAAGALLWILPYRLIPLLRPKRTIPFLWAGGIATFVFQILLWCPVNTNLDMALLDRLLGEYFMAYLIPPAVFHYYFRRLNAISA